MNDLKTNVSELSTCPNSLSPNYISKNSNEKQIDLLLHENHCCLITNSHNFYRKIENCTQFCRRCSNTYADYTKHE